MKRHWGFLFFLLALLVSAFAKASSGKPFVRIPLAYASSQQAYQDYLYQYDRYRQTLTDFKVARNEYQKFKSLASETAALEKSRELLSQRDLALRAYLLLLNEKLNEDTGLSSAEKLLYQSLIRNEVGFLENHSRLVDSIGSLDDAERVSGQLTARYDILSASIRQTIATISIGQLTGLAKQYDAIRTQAQALIATNRNALPPQKQATLDRWLLSITNKRSLYQQKIETVRTKTTKLKGDVEELDREFAVIQKGLSEARQYLSEGLAFLRELVTSLKYSN